MVSFQHDRPAKISSLCIFVVVVYQSFFYLYIYSYFIFGCGGSPLKPVGFLQLPQTGTALCCSVWPPHCCDFSCWGAPALVTQASAAVVCRLSCPQHGESSQTRGIKPVCPALAGGFLSYPLYHQRSPSLYNSLFFFLFLALPSIWHHLSSPTSLGPWQWKHGVLAVTRLPGNSF